LTFDLPGNAAKGLTRMKRKRKRCALLILVPLTFGVFGIMSGILVPTHAAEEQRGSG
jgi:hypothetical protein